MDARQFKETFMPHHRLMYGVALRILGDESEAEDALQDVFTSLWERRASLASVENLRAYCVAMTRNRCLAMLSDPSRRPGSLPQMSEQGDDARDERRLEQRDRLELVERVLDTLPGRYGEIVRRHCFEGEPLEDVARDLDLSGGNIRVILSRARKAVREYFIKRNEYDR